MDKVYEYAFNKLIIDGDIDTDYRIELIEELVQFGMDINSDYSRLLINAIDIQDMKLVNYLIEKGINIRARDDYPLTMACIRNDFSIIKLLLELGAKANNEMIKILCVTPKHINLNVVKILVEFGADPFVDSKLLYSACEYGNVELLEYLISIGVDCTKDKAIDWAFGRNENLKIRRLLLENDANPNVINSLGFCLLELCVITHKIDSCKLLFEYGADINLCQKIINEDNFKKINLTTTQEIVDLFMERGLDISKLLK